MRTILVIILSLVQVWFGCCQRRNGCSVQIVVDPFLESHLRGVYSQQRPSELDIRRKIVSFVGEHFQFVNQVLERYHFLPSGDPVKIFPTEIQILNFSKCVFQGVDYCQENDDDLLNMHSSVNKTQFCLSYLFTYRDLKGGYLGMAWTASSKKADEGGVCSRYVQKDPEIIFEDFETKENWPTEKSEKISLQSRNTGLVSFKYHGTLVPTFVSKLAFLHEIGHSLGSPHDYPRECLESETGYFVMHMMGGLNGFLDNSHDNVQFSDCSIKNISLALAALNAFSRNCLQQLPASVCGNGLVEGWEECDCGSDEECEQDRCCHPPSHGDKACQRKNGAQCSLSEGACCTEDCKLLTKNDEFQCSEETECSSSAICDGSQASCPNPQPKATTDTCRGGTMVCFKGQCSRSACNRFNMIPCKPNFQHPCEVHCQIPRRKDTCAPTSEKGPLFNSPVYQPVNTFCQFLDTSSNNTMTGFCSSHNFCQTFYETEAVSSTSWVVGLIIFLVCYIILMIICIWVYCRYCKGASRHQHIVITSS